MIPRAKLISKVMKERGIYPSRFQHLSSFYVVYVTCDLSIYLSVYPSLCRAIAGCKKVGILNVEKNMSWMLHKIHVSLEGTEITELVNLFIDLIELEDFFFSFYSKCKLYK